MTQTVERERAYAATAVSGALADDAALDIRQCEQLAELLTEQTRSAPRQRRKEKLVVALRRRQREQVIFKRLVDDGDDLCTRLAHQKVNGLDVGDKIDIAPAKVRAIEET